MEGSSEHWHSSRRLVVAVDLAQRMPLVLAARCAAVRFGQWHVAEQAFSCGIYAFDESTIIDSYHSSNCGLEYATQFCRLGLQADLPARRLGS